LVWNYGCISSYRNWKIHAYDSDDNDDDYNTYSNAPDNINDQEHYAVMSMNSNEYSYWNDVRGYLSIANCACQYQYDRMIDNSQSNDDNDNTTSSTNINNLDDSSLICSDDSTELHQDLVDFNERYQAIYEWFSQVYNLLLHYHHQHHNSHHYCHHHQQYHLYLCPFLEW